METNGLAPPPVRRPPRRSGVLPDGTKIHENDDGSIEQINPNGVKILKKKDGSRVQSMLDGTTISVETDGSIVQTHTDGTTVRVGKDGITEHFLPDGSVLREYPDGSKRQTLPNGDSVTLHADGTKILTRGDGTTVETMQDGDDEVQVVKDSGGHTLLSMRIPKAGDGSSGTAQKPQVQMLQFEDGTTVEKYPDGRKVQTNPNGLVIESLPDGTILQKMETPKDASPGEGAVAEKPWAKKIIRHPDGSLWQKNSDGVVIEFDPDFNEQRETLADGTTCITNLSQEKLPIDTTIITPDGSKRKIMSMDLSHHSVSSGHIDLSQENGTLETVYERASEGGDRATGGSEPPSEPLGSNTTRPTLSPWVRRQPGTLGSAPLCDPPPAPPSQEDTKPLRVLGVVDEQEMKNRKAMMALGIADVSNKDSMGYDKALRTLGEDSSAIAMSKSELVAPRPRVESLEDPRARDRRARSRSQQSARHSLSPTVVITSNTHEWVKPGNKSITAKTEKTLGVDVEDVRNSKAMKSLGMDLGSSLEEQKKYDKALRMLGEDTSAIAKSKTPPQSPRIDPAQIPEIQVSRKASTPHLPGLPPTPIIVISGERASQSKKLNQALGADTEETLNKKAHNMMAAGEKGALPPSPARKPGGKDGVPKRRRLSVELSDDLRKQSLCSIDDLNLSSAISGYSEETPVAAPRKQSCGSLLSTEYLATKNRFELRAICKKNGIPHKTFDLKKLISSILEHQVQGGSDGHTADAETSHYENPIHNSSQSLRMPDVNRHKFLAPESSSHTKSSSSVMAWFQKGSLKKNASSADMHDFMSPCDLSFDSGLGSKHLWLGDPVVCKLDGGKSCSLRLATIKDCDRIYILIQELAESQRTTSTITMDDLKREGFTPGVQPRFQVILVFLDAELVGFTLFHETYSVWHGKGIQIENVYVREKHRDEGIDALLMQTLGRRALAEAFHRLTWQSMKWDEPAHVLHSGIGGIKMDEEYNWHMEGDVLRKFCAE